VVDRGLLGRDSRIVLRAVAARAADAERVLGRGRPAAPPAAHLRPAVTSRVRAGPYTSARWLDELADAPDPTLW
jgi:hypothetical protein